MFAKLRIIFTIIAAILLFIFFPVGVIWGFGWAAIDGLAAGVFFIFMLFCKQQQEIREKAKEQSNQPVGDFLHPIQKTETQSENQTSNEEK